VPGVRRRDLAGDAAGLALLLDHGAGAGGGGTDDEDGADDSRDGDDADDAGTHDTVFLRKISSQVHGEPTSRTVDQC